MTLNKQKLPLIFVHKTKVSFCGDDLQDAILIRATKPVQQVKNIFLYGRYPAISIGGKKLHIHRLLLEYYLGRRLGEFDVTHHINSNRLDCRKENLQCLSCFEHGSLHNKGKKLSTEHKAKIAEANRNRKGMVYKERIHIPLWLIKSLLQDGVSVNCIAKYFECDWSTIKKRIHENPELLEKI